MIRHALLYLAIGTAAAGCTRPTALPVPAARSLADLPAGQYYDQGLPAPHDVHVRPYTTLVPEPEPAGPVPRR